MIFKNKFLVIFVLTIILITFSAGLSAQQLSGEKNAGVTEIKEELNSSIIFIMALILILVLLFIWEPMPISLMAVLVPIALTIFSDLSQMTVEDALSGFGNPATITVMAMFVFSAGIQRSGAVQLLGDRISKLTGKNPKRQITLISALTGSTSAVINNTPVVAALIPMVRELGRKTDVSPSKLLIPLSYAAMLGGTVTLIGTSTNLLASQVSERMLGHPFSMFEFSLLGLIVLFIGIVYLLTVGYKLTPARLEVEDDLTDEYEMRSYLTEVLVGEDCSFVGKSFDEIAENKDLDYDIIRIIRNGKQFMEPLNAKTVRVGDHLIIRAKQDTLLELTNSKGMKTLPEMVVDDDSIEQPLAGETLVEVVVPAHSFLVNKTLKEINFLERYDCNVLALRRGEELTHQRMEDYRFQPGDLLLLLSTEKTLNRLRKNSNFIIDREYDPNLFDRKKMYISLAVLVFFIGSVSLGIIPVAIAALSGAFLMAFSGCINKNDFFNAIDWEVYFLLSGLIPMGMAIERSGTAAYIAAQINNLAAIFQPIFILMIIYLLTSLLTNLISNNASVLLMLPIAVGTAEQLGINPFAFVITTTFAASAAFASPVGYQTNLMVYSSGGFKFKDFIIVGAPLQILLTVIVPLLVKMIWGF
ncbi:MULTISPECIES: SLC13 family permease [Halanaerobium]|jgi:di/tricarboxylate transporter|uniref:Di/tricarboxylate transporter n=1 Tax=Halanaerobium saccharolyticum TaxID=43595 RepID=A0A4V3CX76_9FIRM|nr:MULTISPECIES: SLC13 family permease [Halanaerobium]PUU91619.1 MAG: TrkA-C domain-containing protein [Halanaerobium sp.]TDP89098.1 di/tricarboxylate transporter [Halanaerobium saccharolyticum]